MDQLHIRFLTSSNLRLQLAINISGRQIETTRNPTAVWHPRLHRELSKAVLTVTVKVEEVMARQRKFRQKLEERRKAVRPETRELRPPPVVWLGYFIICITDTIRNNKLLSAMCRDIISHIISKWGDTSGGSFSRVKGNRRPYQGLWWWGQPGPWGHEHRHPSHVPGGNNVGLYPLPGGALLYCIRKLV